MSGPAPRPPSPRPSIRAAGFTMTELMVVVVCVGVLAAVATPYVAKDRKAGRGREFAHELLRELQRVRIQALSERLPVRVAVYRDRVELKSWIAGARQGDPPRAPLSSDPILRKIPAPTGIDVYDVLINAASPPSSAYLTASASRELDFNAQGQMQVVGQAPMAPAFVYIKSSNVRSNHPEAHLRLDIRGLTGYVALREGWN
jgi:prepilin-type N-terminal cleavage/methylation domain-containing protein